MAKVVRGPFFILLLMACSPAAAAAMPSPARLQASLRALNLPTEARDSRLSHNRFPLSFPADRRFGTYLANGTGLRIAVNGHGPNPRRLLSVSFETLFWTRPDLSRFDEDAGRVGRFVAGSGLGRQVGDSIAALLRAARQRFEAVELEQGQWRKLVLAETARAGGYDIRAEGDISQGPGGVGAHVIIQVTTLSAPQVDWPSPREIEALQPRSRAQLVWTGGDVADVIEPEVFDLRCRALPRNAVRCSYATHRDERGRAADHYSDVFRRSGDGSWRLEK